MNKINLIRIRVEKSMKKQPPKENTPNTQLDLFSRFLTNDKNAVSNTIDMWDCIPKYFFSPALSEKLRPETGQPDPYKLNFSFHEQPCDVRIQPALLEKKDGTFKAYYPGVTEELVEEALKKILTDQRSGFHDPDSSETWVKFTLRMIYKELKSKGKERNITEIRQAIDVMSSTIITVTKSGKESWSGAILQDLVTADRDDYLADGSSYHMCRLPLFVSIGINTLAYRQFNYNRLMSCNEQLSRWIYKLLISRFRQASMMNDYHFLFSNLKTSGMLQQKLETGNRRKVIKALEELKEVGALKNYKADARKEGRVIVDVKYTLYPSGDFVKEQKASNKRQKDAIEEAIKQGVTYVSK